MYTGRRRTLLAVGWRAWPNGLAGIACGGLAGQMASQPQGPEATRSDKEASYSAVPIAKIVFPQTRLLYRV